MECTHLTHGGFSDLRIRLGRMTCRIPEPNPSQPEDEFVPKLVKPRKSHG